MLILSVLKTAKTGMLGLVSPKLNIQWYNFVCYYCTAWWVVYVCIKSSNFFLVTTFSKVHSCEMKRSNDHRQILSCQNIPVLESFNHENDDEDEAKDVQINDIDLSTNEKIHLHLKKQYGYNTP